MKCPPTLAISKALTIYPTNVQRPLFNSQFFSKPQLLYWSQDTLRSRNMQKLDLNFFVCFFFKENSCLNFFTVGRIKFLKNLGF